MEQPIGIILNQLEQLFALFRVMHQSYILWCRGRAIMGNLTEDSPLSHTSTARIHIRVLRRSEEPCLPRVFQDYGVRAVTLKV